MSAHLEHVVAVAVLVASAPFVVVALVVSAYAWATRGKDYQP